MTAQRQAHLSMGVPAERIYTGKGLTGTNRNRPTCSANHLNHPGYACAGEHSAVV